MLRNVIQSIEAMGDEEISQAFAERRQGIRVKSYAQVRLGQQRGVVVELSLAGLRLKSSEAPLVEGQCLEVAYGPLQESTEAEIGPVRVKVSWVQRIGRDFVAGAHYHDSPENLQQSWVRQLWQEIGLEGSQAFQRRRSLRVDASIPARIFCDKDCLVPDGRLVNLGIGGCLLESELPLQVGGDFSVEMSLWRILPTLRLSGEALAVRRDADTGLNLTSLRFERVEADQLKLLGNYIINMINQSVEG